MAWGGDNLSGPLMAKSLEQIGQKPLIGSVNLMGGDWSNKLDVKDNGEFIDEEANAIYHRWMDEVRAFLKLPKNQKL